MTSHLRIVTVASDPTDGYERFMESCKYWNFDPVVLGMGQLWTWDLTQAPGGGRKVNLLKEYLNQISSDSDTELILFSDSYDVVVNDFALNIINKFNKFDADILFSAETMIWPDKNIETKFPRMGSNPYIYLNSGGFIGSIKAIRQIISEPIDDAADDQLYYQKIFLNNLQYPNSNFRIKLDYKCEIFQTMSSRFIEIYVDKSTCKIVNKLFPLSSPCIVHGNGGVKSKMHLNSLSNYLPKYSTHLTDLSPNKTITFLIHVTGDYAKSNLSNLLEQNYPQDLCKYIFYGREKPINMSYVLDKNVFKIVNDNSDIRNLFMEVFSMCETDYYFLGSTEHLILDVDTISKLMGTGKNIISPMLLSKQNNYLSNFWGDVSDDGFYKRSDDYVDIINYRLKGIWNVPYVSSSILIRKNRIPDVLKELSANDIGGEDWDMYFCRVLRKKYIFLHVDNRESYGMILDKIVK